MATEIRVPTLGESVTEATIGKWFKKAGDAVAVDEPLVELETDKVTVEVPSPTAGTLTEIAAKEGDTVAVGALLGSIGEGGAGCREAGRESGSRRRKRRSNGKPRWRRHPAAQALRQRKRREAKSGRHRRRRRRSRSASMQRPAAGQRPRSRRRPTSPRIRCKAPASAARC